jgi:CHAD domain-containing protein
MQKHPMKIAVKRAEGAWDRTGRTVSSGTASVPPQESDKVGSEWTWDRVLEGARRQLDELISLEPKVLKGRDAEAIHDIRVAGRRLQQVLDLLYPSPRPAKVRRVRRTIRRSRRTLSGVRNCDVLLERARRVLSRKRAVRRDVWAAFQDFLEARRGKTFRKASRRLAALNLPASYVRLQEQIQKPPSSTGNASSDASSPQGVSLRARLNESLQETWSSLERCVEQARETPEAASLHATRIAAKKTRYLIEVIDVLGVPRSRQALACLRGLQQHLGDWHDLEVLEEMMLEMVARPSFLADRLELAIEVERLVLRNRKSKAGYVEQFLRMTGESDEWRALRGWVRDFLAAEEQPSELNRAESQSPAFVMPRA